MPQTFREEQHECDLCVVGGGMAGLCAAIAAARHGARVVLMHDRPVFGGNASSECRVHVCGADRQNGIKNMRETGILEELRLANLHRNPQANLFFWDLVLYEAAHLQENLRVLYNCSCLGAGMAEGSQVCAAQHYVVEMESVLLPDGMHNLGFQHCLGTGYEAAQTLVRSHQIQYLPVLAAVVRH